MRSASRGFLRPSWRSLCFRNLPVGSSLSAGRSFPCRITLHFGRRFRISAPNERNLLLSRAMLRQRQLPQLQSARDQRHSRARRGHSVKERISGHAKISAPEILRVGRARHCEVDVEPASRCRSPSVGRIGPRIGISRAAPATASSPLTVSGAFSEARCGFPTGTISPPSAW